MNKIRKVSLEQRAEICNRFKSGESAESIAQSFDMTGQAVKYHLLHGGIDCKKGFRKISKEDEMIICERFERGEQATAIAADLNITKQSVYNILKDNDIKKHTQHRAISSYTLNENAFDEITEESAYWVGFLMADGCVIEHTRGLPEIALVQSVKEIAQIEKFRAFLGSNHSINCQKSTKSARFGVRSRRIANRLRDFGITPRKSLTARVIGLENNRHFWRGEFDGDGSIYFLKKRRYQIAVDLCGSFEMMNQFKAFVLNSTDIGDITVHNKGKVSHVILHSLPAIKVIDLLYTGSTVSLDRKMQRAEKAVAMYLGYKSHPDSGAIVGENADVSTNYCQG